MHIRILSQGDPVDAIFPFMILAGFLLIPATLAAWVLAISHAKRERHFSVPFVVAGVLTVLSITWGIFFWELNREMQDFAVNDGEASMIVNRLPEVDQYERAAPKGGLKRCVMFDEGDPSTPPHTWSIIVGEEGPKGRETTWHRFRVDMKTGNVSVLIDASLPPQWVTLEKWRTLKKTGKSKL